MTARSTSPFLSKLGILPARRVLAIDPGHHCIKALVVEESFGRIRLLDYRMFDLHEERVLSDEELPQHLMAMTKELGEYPIALALPQHLSMSQVLDSASDQQQEIQKLVEKEATHLSGLAESTAVYDFVPLRPFGKSRNPYWVTFCQEDEILGLLDRLGLRGRDVCEVTTPANALIAAAQATLSDTDRTILVDVGANSTVVVIMVDGQGVYATSFPIGGGMFTDAVANHKNCSAEVAESTKRTLGFFDGSEACAALETVVDGWYLEIDRIVNEWLQSHPENELSRQNFQVVLSGGGSLQPGFAEHLTARGALKFSLWSKHAQLIHDEPFESYVVAYGVALETLNKKPQRASLLPASLRADWKKRMRRQRLLGFDFVALLLLALVLGLGTWRKVSLINQKNHLLGLIQEAQEMARARADVTRQSLHAYEQVRPVLEQQKRTADALRTLALLDQARTNHNFWTVLIADAQSYFSTPVPAPPSTNAPPTNAPPVAVEMAPLTNLILQAPFEGYVVEVCLPEEGEAMRRNLSQIVAQLKQASDLYRKVDSMPTDWRRMLVDTQVVLSGRHLALTLELETNVFAAPPVFPPPEKPIQPAARETPSGARSFRQKAEAQSLLNTVTNR